LAPLLAHRFISSTYWIDCFLRKSPGLHRRWRPLRFVIACISNDARSKLAVISPTFEAIRVPATTEVRGGAAGSEIVKAAVDYGADLIVMTTHGRSGLPHLVLGSVAEHVIRHARCPVLAIRANETETTEGAGIQGIGRVA
jgi:Universal stress protein family